MNSHTSEHEQQQQALREQMEREHERRAALEAQLDAVNLRFGALATRREPHELLGQLGAAFARLDELGATELFWDDAAGMEAVRQRMSLATQRAAAFAREIGEVEAQRASLARELDDQAAVLGELGDELDELYEAEERRKLEWVLEREPGKLPFRALVMPWTRGVDEDRRFQRFLAGALVASLLLGIILRAIDLPMLERAELIEVPERVAKLIEATPKPPPAPVVAEEPPPVEPVPEEPVMAEEQPPEPRPDQVEQPRPATEPPKQAVQSKGILAFRDSFSKRAQTGPSAKLGAQAKVGNAGEAAVGRPQRSMVTTQAPGSSGGINLAAVSRDVGGGGGRAHSAGSP